jgi:alpha-ketoglutarate-dependent taurine dioxygenase
MRSLKSEQAGIKRLPAVRRKAINVEDMKLVESRSGEGQEALPLVVEPTVDGVELQDWVKSNQDFVQARILEHGAILFRNFAVRRAIEFEQVLLALCGKLMEYLERSSPRSQISDKVYTSTDYPADQSIFPHNEHSYSLTFPLKVSFCCLQAAQSGGETPLVNMRRVSQRINPDIKERFIRKGWMYVRNYNDGFGLPWQTVFQTKDRSRVQDYCRQAGIEYEWKDDQHLRTRQVRPALIRHPRTGETLWFNHVTFFHVSTLEPALREMLLREFKEEDLPHNTYYGDGSRIEASVLDELRTAYLQEMVAAPWQAGDVLILDNMLTAHGRRPYTGARKVLFAMAEPVTRTDTQTEGWRLEHV